VDNLTHVLSGALLGAALTPDDQERAVPARTRVVLAVVATNLPDLDLLFGLFADPLALLNLHRGITHSFLAAPLLGLAAAAVAHQLTGRRHRLRDLWLIATLAVLLHCGLDLLTAYGTQILAPFSARAFALPLLFIIDPLVWLLLGTACVLAWHRGSSAIAQRGLLALGAYVVVCGMAMLWATRIAQLHAKQQGLAQVVVALPQPLSPAHWKLVIVDGEEYRSSYLDILGFGPRAPADPDANFLARTWAAYQPADALNWRRRHRYGIDPMMRGFTKYAWRRDEMAEFRRFALLPQVYGLTNRGVDSGCGWFTDLRFETPAFSPPFRYGMCHGPVDGRLHHDRGWTLELDGAPRLGGR
jgi:inner membrane protein